MSNISESQLYKDTISEVNIYNAIYALESFVFEKGLLAKDDIELYNKLSDKFNFKFIDSIISSCQKRLKEILDNDDSLFNISVFFKLKKIDNGKIEYRPIHTADLITQICMVCLLNKIMFEDDLDKVNGDDVIEDNKLKFEHGYKRNLSDVSKLIPANFYGNLPSQNIDYLFVDWKGKYKEYSDQVISKYKEYKENMKYTHEVCLDLEKFFPSIDPQFIYSFIVSKLKTTHGNRELDCLKILVKKLLYFKINEIEPWLNDYYVDCDIKKIKSTKTYYNMGIPQGLPQAYFFGNLCMIEISKSIVQKFPGDAFFYVDDSVIYTKTNETDFVQNIELVNLDIQKRFKKISENERIDIKTPDLIAFNKLLHYNIKIHKEDKSTITKIDQYKFGVDNLGLLAQPASGLSFIVNSTIDEIEDATQLNKIKSILQLIDSELVNLVENKTVDELKSLKNYLKLLKRYKKFYLFRLQLLELREDNDITEKTLIKFFLKYFELDIEHFLFSEIQFNKNVLISYLDKIFSEDSDWKKKFFHAFEEEIFITEIHINLDYLAANPELSIKFKEALIYLESKISGENVEMDKNLYFSKDIDGTYEFKKLNKEIYSSLPFIVKEFVQPCYKISTQKELDILERYCYNIENENCIDKYFNKPEIDSRIRFVYNTSEEFKRKIINAIFSHVINVNINDDYCFIKNDNRALLYFELRILTFSRNKNFKISEFLIFIESIIINAKKDILCERIDNRIIEVIPQFIKYVKKPQEIDDLILTHRLVNSLWKNGSRFLHFFTLHDEEHSIELINSSTKIIRTVDYFKIKEFDYYILFLACYLHDIAMVIHPKLESFCETNNETDRIYTQWIKDIYDINGKNKPEIKNIILEYFNHVNSFFETKVRVNHAKDSARFIKKRNELNYLNKSVLQNVADVSESHNYNSSDVYGLHSSAKEDVVSLKYLMIILRLADLTDMSKDRISQNVLKENIDHMDNESKFHWISHLITDDCNIKANFTLNKQILEKIKNNDKYIPIITRGAIDENIEINIYLNTKNLTSVYSNNCINCNASLNSKERIIEISINPEKNLCSNNCNFLCKWVMNKHQYLFNELSELQKYLSNVSYGVFNTNFKVNLLYKNTNKLPEKYMEVISERIDI